MNAIEIKNLHFSYGKENVLDGVSLCLKEGRLAILAGENGAGKSTLLRLLLGELPIGESHKGDQEEGSSDGSIEILGQDIRRLVENQLCAAERDGWLEGFSGIRGRNRARKFI